MNNVDSISWYCPNCGNMVYGHYDEEGSARLTCKKCGIRMTMHHKSRRQSRLDLIAPAGQQFLYG